MRRLGEVHGLFRMVQHDGDALVGRIVFAVSAPFETRISRSKDDQIGAESQSFFYCLAPVDGFAANLKQPVSREAGAKSLAHSRLNLTVVALLRAYPENFNFFRRELQAVPMVSHAGGAVARMRFKISKGKIS